MNEHYGSVSVNIKNASCDLIDPNPVSWHYYIMPEIHSRDEQDEQSLQYSYGIQVTGVVYNEILHDVSNDRETVERMVGMFNRHQLSPVHLPEAIEEMLEL